ncbi:Calcium/calmodulin dependent protein kinase II association-domain-containing protein [Zopfochytrium polystomum]|nr:Calcium/calmodulin dependent protein kinase II association-domain-containing protein [Zopfochytrium polystomum]
MAPVLLPFGVTDPSAHLIALNQTLLEAITEGDWATYEALTTPSMTCFEPEAGAHLVSGHEFHRFYFQMEERKRADAERVAAAQSKLAQKKESVASATGTATAVASSSVGVSPAADAAAAARDPEAVRPKMVDASTGMVETRSVGTETAGRHVHPSHLSNPHSQHGHGHGHGHGAHGTSHRPRLLSKVTSMVRPQVTFLSHDKSAALVTYGLPRIFKKSTLMI